MSRTAAELHTLEDARHTLAKVYGHIEQMQKLNGVVLSEIETHLIELTDEIGDNRIYEDVPELEIPEVCQIENES